MIVGGPVESLKNFNSKKVIKQGESSTEILFHSSNVIWKNVNKLSEKDHYTFYEKGYSHFLFLGKIISPLTQKEIAKKLSLNSNDQNQFLRNLSGIFAIIWYNSESGVTKIFTDRYGLYAIYIWKYNGCTIWSNDIKSFLGIPGFTININPDAIRCFCYSGQHIGKMTWFENVEMLNPSSLYEFKMDNNTYSQTYYWTWEDLNKQRINIKEATNTSIELLSQSVENNLVHSKNPVLLLSGGKDSTTILKLDRERKINNAFTFDYERKNEYINAAKVVKKHGTRHSHLIINDRNWWKNKKEAVIDLSCEISLLHCHFSPFIGNTFVRDMDLFTGISGDLTLGGQYISSLDTRINKELVTSYENFNYLSEYAAFIEDPYFSYPGSDPFVFHTRIRRFTIIGMKYFRGLLHLAPLMDTTLNDHLYSLPDEYRRDNFLYNQILDVISDNHKKARKLTRDNLYLKYIWMRYGNPPFQRYYDMLFESEIKSYKYLNEYQSYLEFNKARPAFFNDLRACSLEIWLRYLFDED